MKFALVKHNSLANTIHSDFRPFVGFLRVIAVQVLV